jgi:transposase-like protein
MAIDLTDPVFTDENKAREHLETIRWPNGPICPHCGSVDKVYRLSGKSHRPGLIHCNNCDGSFTVTTGSVMESSHVPLNKWVLAYRLMASSKKGISAHQLHRTIAVTYKTAWFMAHRIRESMRPTTTTPLGGGGKVVEADETYIGRLEGQPKARAGVAHKNVVLTLVERGGSARSFHLAGTRMADITPVVVANIVRESALMTDEASYYRDAGREFKSHETVNHSIDEYVRGHVTTNTVEGFFSVFKRGMKGTYQHCSEKHLHRYLSEFDFRYSNRIALGVNDTERAKRAIKGAEGKRLTYRQPRSAQPA